MGLAAIQIGCGQIAPLTPVAPALSVDNRLWGLYNGLMSKRHTAIYGNVNLGRVFCDKCHRYTILDGVVKECCGEPCSDEQTDDLVRMANPEPRRRGLTSQEKQSIIEAQGGVCLYCGSAFGLYYLHHGKLRINNPCWDHRTPFKYSQNNNFDNYAATCRYCNQVKYSKMFKTIEEVRDHVTQKDPRIFEEVPGMWDSIHHPAIKKVLLHPCLQKQEMGEGKSTLLHKLSVQKNGKWYEPDPKIAWFIKHYVPRVIIDYESTAKPPEGQP